MSTGGANKSTNKADEEFNELMLQLADDPLFNLEADEISKDLLAKEEEPQLVHNSRKGSLVSLTHSSDEFEEDDPKKSTKEPKNKIGRKPLITPCEQVKDVDAELTKLTAELEQYQSQKDSLKLQSKSSKKDQKKSLQEQNKRYLRHISRLKKAIIALQERKSKTKLLEERDALAKAYNSANQTAEELKQAHGKLANLELEKSELQKSIQKKEAELTVLLSQFEQAERTQQQAQEKINKEKAESKKVIETLVRLNDSESARIQVLEENLTNLEETKARELAALRSQITFLTTKTEETSARCKRFEHQCIELEKKLYQEQLEIRRLQDLHARLENHYAAFKEANEQAVLKLEYQNREKLDRIEHLQYLLKQVTSERDYQLARADQRISDLENEIASMNKIAANPPIVYQHRRQRTHNHPRREQDRFYSQYNDVPFDPKTGQRSARK